MNGHSSQSPVRSPAPRSTITGPDRLGRSYLIRWLLGLVAIALLAIPSTLHSAAAIATLRNVPDRWLPDDLPLKKAFDQYITQFGSPDVIFISWPGAELDSDSVRDVTRSLRQLSHDQNNFSPGRIKTPAAIAAARRYWSNTIKPPSDEQIFHWVRSGTEIRDALMLPPLGFSSRGAAARLRGTLVGDDGRQTCVVAAFTESSGPHQRVLLPMLRQAVAQTTGHPIDQVYLVGGAVDGEAVDNEAIRSIQRYSLPSAIVAGILCLWFLRSVCLTLTILGIASVGQGMSLAGVYYLGVQMNAILIVLPPLIFVLTVSSGIHLSNYYFDFLRANAGTVTAGRPPVDAAVLAAKQAMKVGTAPCLIATFTTVVGLMSLCLVRLEPARVFGVLGSIGIVWALGFLVLMLPGAMILSRRYSGKSRDRVVRYLVSPQSRWLKPKWILGIFASLCCLAVVGLGQLKTSVSVPRMFLPDSDLVRNYVWYEKNVGATMTAEVLLTFSDPPHGDTADLNNLAANHAIKQYQQVVAVHTALVKLPEIGGALSAANFLPLPVKSRGIAATATRAAIRSEISDPASNVSSLGYLRQQHRPGTPDGRIWRLSLRLYQIGDAEFSRAIRKIKQTVDQTLARGESRLPPPTVDLTGHVVMVDGTQQLLLGDLFSSFFAAFAIIAVLMACFLRSLVGGLLAMIPNLVPTLVLFGSMGWIKSPLDIGSVMTASVALGIAVDDSVHLLAQYRLASGVSADRRGAAVAALRHCGWAMTQTTIVCGLSLLVYGLSSFVPTRRFSFFMLGLLVLAWLGVSTLLPAIMATRFGRFLAKQPRVS